MNTFVMIIGYICLSVIVLICLIPILRGISSGLFMTVLYYKLGCSKHLILKQFMKAFTKDPFMWIIGVDSCTSYSIGDNYWDGIFKWSFDDGLNRKNFTKVNNK